MNEESERIEKPAYSAEPYNKEAAMFKHNSVFDGDVPFITFSTDGGRECGKLWGRGGVLSFEGNADESAQVFFDKVVQLNRDWLMLSNKRESQKEQGNGLST
jgi:hypothetical protein